MDQTQQDLPRTGGGSALPIATATRGGDFIFVSGHIGVTLPDMDIPYGVEAQTRAALTLISRTLAEHKATLQDVVKATVWLSDTRDFGRFNKVWVQVFGTHRVARSTVRADLMEDAKVEIEVLAYKPLRQQ